MMGKSKTAGAKHLFFFFFGKQYFMNLFQRFFLFHPSPLFLRISYFFLDSFSAFVP